MKIEDLVPLADHLIDAHRASCCNYDICTAAEEGTSITVAATSPSRANHRSAEAEPQVLLPRAFWCSSMQLYLTLHMDKKRQNASSSLPRHVQVSTLPMTIQRLGFQSTPVLANPHNLPACWGSATQRTSVCAS